MSYLGIDVSEFQGNINWKSVRDCGYEFTMVRSGYGTDYKDPYFTQNVNNARKNGLNVGAYHFVYALNVEDAIKNAKWFVKLLNEHKGKINYPVACDFEYDSLRYMKQHGVKPTKKLCTDIVNAFCNEVEKSGYYVMNYANPDFIENWFNDVSKYDLWLAQWGTYKPQYKCNMWQHSSQGNVRGIIGKTDLDISYIDFPSLLKEHNLNFLTDNTETNKPDKDDKEIKVGDYVKVIKPIIYGTNKKFDLYYDEYEVMEISGNRVVIGVDGVVTSAINIKNIRRV